MPLKLSLRPGEAVIVNGAVLRNGSRRGSVLLENQARILREKDVMYPEALGQPVANVYFSVMQLYLTGDVDGAAFDQTASALAELIESSDDADAQDIALDISAACAAGQAYRALSLARRLMRDHDGRDEDGGLDG